MATETPTQQTFLQFFPLTLFAAVSTLSSLSFGWGSTGFAFALELKEILGLAAIGIFVLLSITYLLKWIKYPEQVKQNFNDPVGINIFGIFFISLMLVAGLLRPYDHTVSLVIWAIGALLTFLFGYMVVDRWFSRQQNTLQALPVWVVPAVGLLDIPLTGYAYGNGPVREVCLIFFASGLLFASVVIVFVFQRLIFQEVMERSLRPTLLLLAVPFALFYADYDLMTGRQDLIASISFYMSIVLLILFGRRLALCLMHVEFSITWWSTSFPMAAVTAASFRYASHLSLPGARIIPVILLVISSLIFLALLVQTLYYIVAHFIIKSCPKPKKRYTLHDMMKHAA
jgi:tellurite resistance protein